MDYSISLTKRVRKRKLRDGAAVTHTRYVLNYRDPHTGGRRQEFFETPEGRPGAQDRAHPQGRQRHLRRPQGRPDDRRGDGPLARGQGHRSSRTRLPATRSSRRTSTPTSAMSKPTS